MKKITITIIEHAPGKVEFDMRGGVSACSMVQAFAAAFRHYRPLKELLEKALANANEKTDDQERQSVFKIEPN